MFANPGTSGCLVSAIGKDQSIRSVLGLFEGVCSALQRLRAHCRKTRMTLLHRPRAFQCLQTHNAKKAFSPVINLIGDHALIIKNTMRPLTPISKDCRDPLALVPNGAHCSDLPQAAGSRASGARCRENFDLIIPADCAWDESVAPVAALPVPTSLCR